MDDKGLVGSRGTNEYTISDDKAVLEFYLAHKDDTPAEIAHAVCTNTDFWGEDLSQIPGFEKAVAGYLTEIQEKGTYAVMEECLNKAE